MSTPKRIDFSDPRWLRVRADIIDRDKACYMCGATIGDNKKLVAHHKAYIDDREEWDHPLELKVCMCDKCHQSIYRPGSIPVFQTEEEALAFVRKTSGEIQKVDESEKVSQEKKKGVTGHKYAALSVEEREELDALVVRTGTPSTKILQISFKLLMNKVNFINKFDKDEMMKSIFQ